MDIHLEISRDVAAAEYAVSNHTLATKDMISTDDPIYLVGDNIWIKVQTPTELTDEHAYMCHIPVNVCIDTITVDLILFTITAYTP